MEINIYNQHFILSPEKVLFWKEQHTLVIADAHFSKEMHFRKNGIPVPGGILQFDLKRIDGLLHQYQPQKILFLGDMFHSEVNEGLSEFVSWRKQYPALRLQLIIGNHDILDRNWYRFADIDCVDELLITDNIVWSHDSIITENKSLINISGHIHPYIHLSGNAKQSLKLPCFWCSEDFAILPAFGRFTGGRSVKAAKNDRIFAVGEKEIIEVSGQFLKGN